MRIQNSFLDSKVKTLISSKYSIVKKTILWVGVLLLSTSCSSHDKLTTDNLAVYLQTKLTTLYKLIACAAGGTLHVLALLGNPISIFFLPEGNVINFKYFETQSIESAKNDFSVYKKVSLNHVPIFVGVLQYFKREATPIEKWGIVTYENNGAIHYSNPIRIKFSQRPTEANNSLLTLDQTVPISPRFTWQERLITENVIYFHTITDPNGNLLSGTYTIDKTWQFYDLFNVVLNIRDVKLEPSLLEDQNYQYTILAVSIDNWVNLIIQKDFSTF